MSEHKLKLPRKAQLWMLIGLTALTMSPQYSMQGWQVTGGTLSGMGDWFPRLDSAAWALRAFIEAWVLIYLFSTQAKTRRQAQIITGFEVALIVLIVVTLGPAQAAAGKDQTMSGFLGDWYLPWYYAVASYAPLMLGAAGYAFKVENQQAGAIAEPIAKAITVNQGDNEAITPPVKAKPRRKSKPQPANATDKALEILADNPDISGSELGRMIGKTPSRGRQLKAELLPQIEAPALNGHKGE